MPSISLCMIVRNEEDVLARCLTSVADLVDEIILVDTGSSDRTKEIAARYTDRIFDFPWMDDFAAARNHAFLQATGDYCLWLDADDLLEEADRAAFRTLRQTLSADVDVVMMRYNVAFDGEGRPTFSYYRERLIRNLHKPVWVGAVHEVVPPFGNILYTEIAVTHRKLHPSDPDRNLRIFRTMLQKGIPLDPRQQFYYGRELFYHRQLAEAAAVFERFLDEGKGWVENVIEACRFLSQCYAGLGRERETIGALLASLAFDAPRAEVCCDIGRYFLDRERYAEAAFWYETALSRPRNDRSGGFVLPDCYDYLPAIQLAVVYDRMGDYRRANAYNEQAGRVKPGSPAYRYNRDYFAGRLGLAAQDTPPA